ncbi:MAG: AAA family ATPase [Pseudomonadota bacterium]|nr:AAA family ATPase [Pseudomonadota bacterium]
MTRDGYRRKKLRYRRFEIENFKGIKSAVFDFGENGDARIFTLVGLNEGGKTTVLEAMHAFKPDVDAGTVVGGFKNTFVALRQAVPRSRIADFSGKVSVTATVELNEGDIETITEDFNELGIELEVGCIDTVFRFERYVSFKSGDPVRNLYSLDQKRIRVRTGKQRKFRALNKEEIEYCRDIFYHRIPSIAYFPTFVFDFPEKIFLSKRDGDAKNEFYRKLFQDILDYGGRGYKIESHIVKRVQKPDYVGVWAVFFSLFGSGGERDQITQVVDHAASVVTKVVYKKWTEIFGESVGNKEISIDWELEEGLKERDEKGREVDADVHDIFVRFRVKDGVDRFPVETRSLGFRWFFSFLLFTQFRAGREGAGPIVFLLDEPASNLHASAQQKLLESFPEIARKPHALVYSTHSHYLIEPKWLEQAYIVQNSASNESARIIDDSVFDDATVNIKVEKYKSFVNNDSAAISYFQPIADRLRVVPSKFDMIEPGLIVEGKSDYYLLEYFNTMYFSGDIRIYPALGAGTLSSIVALLKGWGKPVRIVLDSDRKGREEIERYKQLFVLGDGEIRELSEFFPGSLEIEEILSPEDKKELSSYLGKDGKCSKKDISRAFQEALAGGAKLRINSGTISRVKGGLAKAKAFVDAS